MTHKSHVKFICFNASMLNEFVDRILVIILIIIILQGALIDQRAVAAGKNRTLDLNDMTGSIMTENAYQNGVDDPPMEIGEENYDTGKTGFLMETSEKIFSIISDNIN